uniref:60S ribosomal protein L7a n=1 Tax=Mustela putorius furo TaxID=9669 RepID=M3YME3_MUSPF
MLKGKKAKGKKVVPKLLTEEQEDNKLLTPLSEKRPKNFGIGQDIQPRDLTRLVKWPCHIRLQTVQVPPVMNQLSHTLDRHTATLLQLVHRYRPKIKPEKKQRLLAQTKKVAMGKGDVPTKRLPVLRSEVNTVLTLVDNKEAQLVVIVHEVDPTELMVSLPALCQGIPYCIIEGKARLGHLVPRKTCILVAFTQVNSEDKGAPAKLVECTRTNDNDRYEICCPWAGDVPGLKSMAHVAKLEKAKAKEVAAKLG